METLTCPKCHGLMRTYERSGVTVDQCTECRGILLDRGELERLVDAETSFNSEPEYSQPRYDDSRGQVPRYDDSRSRQQYPPHRKKRKSFLEELFD
jgi:Zn-finger nucleic acid-binding protein